MRNKISEIHKSVGISDSDNGYKQTEVGLIPSDWDVKLVDEISEVKSGKRLPLGKSLVDKETAHPYIRVIDMYQGGVSLNDIKYVPNDVFPSIKNYRIYKDDIFISVAGSLGIVGKIPVNLDGANLTENSNKLTNISCNRDYLLYIFMSSLIQNTIESERTLGAQPKLALTRIRKFQIPLPSTLTEQTAIATALSDTDALITSLEKLITKKRNIKQGAMQELLTGKKRLPGFSGKWEVKKLGDVLKIKHGKSQKEIIDENGEYPILATGGIVGKTKIFIYNQPSVLIGRKGTIDAPQYTDKPFWAIDTIFYSEISNMADAQFIFYRFNLIDWYSHNEASGVPSLNARTIEKIEVLFPPFVEEQTAIAQVLNDMDAEIESLERKLDKYKLLKQGMMQELLTGKTRLV